ncbi:hypothetical protein ACFS07_27575 [Undibacterium arcticum]
MTVARFAENCIRVVDRSITSSLASGTPYLMNQYKANNEPDDHAEQK